LQNDNDELALVVETMKAKGYTSPDDFESKYVSSVAAYNSLKLKYDSLVNEYLFVNNKYDSLKSAQTMTSAVDPEIDALMLELDDTKQKNHELEKENAALNRKLKKLNAGSSKK
jgi:peptidoglycan hydrolase CwlO-like protein